MKTFVIFKNMNELAHEIITGCQVTMANTYKLPFKGKRIKIVSIYLYIIIKISFASIVLFVCLFWGGGTRY